MPPWLARWRWVLGPVVVVAGIAAAVALFLHDKMNEPPRAVVKEWTAHRYAVADAEGKTLRLDLGGGAQSDPPPPELDRVEVTETPSKVIVRPLVREWEPAVVDGMSVHVGTGLSFPVPVKLTDALGQRAVVQVREGTERPIRQDRGFPEWAAWQIRDLFKQEYKRQAEPWRVADAEREAWQFVRGPAQKLRTPLDKGAWEGIDDVRCSRKELLVICELWPRKEGRGELEFRPGKGQPDVYYVDVPKRVLDRARPYRRG